MKEYEVIVLPQAQAEADTIRKYQNTVALERGGRFMEAWHGCLAQLRTDPSYQKRKGPYRHVLLGHLPYRVSFEVDGNKVIVFQVRHTSQKPSRQFGP